jgi:23S rRNA-/tRNA-specific pseudouridylate synthase
LAEAVPHTGRTNQIRIHLWSMRIPVLGDPTYLPDRGIAATQTLTVSCPCMCLHAVSLSLNHPDRNVTLTLTSDSPSWARTANPLTSQQAREPDCDQEVNS